MDFHYAKTIRGWLLGLMIGSYLLTAVHIIDAYLDILMAIFTLANTVFLIARFINGGKPIEKRELGSAVLFLIGIGLVFVNYVYSAYVIIKIIVVGILGVRGKRRAYFDRHHPELAAEEALSLPQEEGKTEESSTLSALGLL